jgi:hypothetical protein
MEPAAAQTGQYFARRGARSAVRGRGLHRASPIWVRVADVGPTASAFWRVMLAVPLLWILFFSLASKEKKAALPRAPFLLAGIAFAGDLAFWHWSIQYTSVANSTLLANLASIFVTLAAWVLWKQRPTSLFISGLAPRCLAPGSWCAPAWIFRQRRCSAMRSAW